MDFNRKKIAEIDDEDFEEDHSNSSKDDIDMPELEN